MSDRDVYKVVLKDAAYQKCNIGTESFIYLIMEEAFEAGMAKATYNGFPGLPDAPDFNEWISIKAYEDL